MRFTEKIIGMKVHNLKGEVVGSVADLVITKDKTNPTVNAVVVLFNKISYIGKTALLEPARKIKLMVPIHEIAFRENRFNLTEREENLESRYLSKGEILISKNILDSVISTSRGIAIGRVNDVVIFENGERLEVFGLSVGVIGIVAKLGLEIPIEIIDKGLGKSFAETVISWKYVRDYHPFKGEIELNVGDRIDASNQIDWVESKELKKPKGGKTRTPYVIFPWLLLEKIFSKNKRSKKS
jgi:sporulation protein YlmC with PRC-barrel domain